MAPPSTETAPPPVWYHYHHTYTHTPHPHMPTHKHRACVQRTHTDSTSARARTHAHPTRTCPHMSTEHVCTHTNSTSAHTHTHADTHAHTRTSTRMKPSPHRRDPGAEHTESPVGTGTDVMVRRTGSQPCHHQLGHRGKALPLCPGVPACAMTSLAARALRLREGDGHSARRRVSAQETSAVVRAVRHQTRLAPGSAGFLSEFAMTLFPQKIWAMRFSGSWAFPLSPEPSRGAENAGGGLDEAHRTPDSAGGGDPALPPRPASRILRITHHVLRIAPSHPARPGFHRPENSRPLFRPQPGPTPFTFHR